MIGGVVLIRPGGWGKADIKSVPHAGGRAILKDFSGKSWPVRLFGRVQIRREARALNRLRGMKGIPALHGRVTKLGLLMEKVEGERITRWCHEHPGEVTEMFERLDGLVSQMHARGVVHVDLRKRDNILISPDGQPHVIDFNASFCLAPGSIRERIFFPMLRAIDFSALLKWKALISPGTLSPAEQRRHNRMSRVRRLWIFN